MTGHSKQKQGKENPDATATAFAAKLAKTANESTPEKEAAFEAREAKRDEAVSKALAAHLAKRKK